jgi:hypothetical protein
MAHRRARLLSSAWPFAESSCSSRVYQTISLSFSLILFLCFCFCRCRWFSLLTIWSELNPTAQMAVIPEYALPHLVHFLAHRPGSFCVSTSANASACVHMHMPVCANSSQEEIGECLAGFAQDDDKDLRQTSSYIAFFLNHICSPSVFSLSLSLYIYCM